MEDINSLLTLLGHLFTLMSENNQGLKEYLVELYAYQICKSAQTSKEPTKAIEFLIE